MTPRNSMPAGCLRLSFAFTLLLSLVGGGLAELGWAADASTAAAIEVGPVVIVPPVDRLPVIRPPVLIPPVLDPTVVVPPVVVPPVVVPPQEPPSLFDRARVTEFSPSPGSRSVEPQDPIRALIQGTIVADSLELVVDGRRVGFGSVQWGSPPTTMLTYPVEQPWVPGTRHQGTLSFRVPSTNAPIEFRFEFWVRPPALAELTTVQSGAFVVEVEDFNFSGGASLPAANTMPPPITSLYRGRGAIHDVDYHRNDFGPFPESGPTPWNPYRTGIPAQPQGPSRYVPMIANNDPERELDLRRPGYRRGENYRIGWTTPGEWYNYGRRLVSNRVYTAYAAISHADLEPGRLSARLGQVTSLASRTHQTVKPLGRFEYPGSGEWGRNTLVPLVTEAGRPAFFSANAAGNTTLRLETSSGDIDWFVLTPLPELLARDRLADAPVHSNQTFRGVMRNTGFTREAGEPYHAGRFGGASAWSVWVPPFAGIATVSVEGSDFDGVLAVYTAPGTGTPRLADLRLVASNDDALEELNGRLTRRLDPRVAFNAVGGTRYYVVLDGVNASQGYAAISWSLVSNQGLPLPEVTLTKSPGSPSVVPNAPVVLDATAVLGSSSTNVASSYEWFHEGTRLNVPSVARLVLGPATASVVGTYAVRYTARPIGPSDYPARSVLAGPVGIQINTLGETNAAMLDKLELSRDPPGGSVSLLATAASGPRLQTDPSAPASAIFRGFSGAQIFSSSDASAQPDEPAHGGNAQAYESMWLRYTPIAGGKLEIDTTRANATVVAEAYGPGPGQTHPGDIGTFAAKRMPYDPERQQVPRGEILTFPCVANHQYAIATDRDAVPGIRIVTNHYTLNLGTINGFPPIQAGAAPVSLNLFASPGFASDALTDASVRVELPGPTLAGVSASVESGGKSLRVAVAALPTTANVIDLPIQVRRTHLDPLVQDVARGTLRLQVQPPPSVFRFVTEDRDTTGLAGAATYGGVGSPLTLDSSSTTPGWPAFEQWGRHKWPGLTLDKDPRALPLEPNGAFAPCWYASTRMSTVLQPPDSTRTRLTLYFVDWDTLNQRVQSVSVRRTDLPGRPLLGAPQVLRNFHQGVFLTWDVPGAVELQITNLASTVTLNAVLTAIYWRQPLAGSAGAVATIESTVAGNEGPKVFGEDRGPITHQGGGALSAPPPMFAGGKTHLWNSAPFEADPRAVGSLAALRFVPCWYTTANIMSARLVPPTPGPHRLALYFVDWDTANARRQRVTVRDASVAGGSSHATTLLRFRNGVYLVYDAPGAVDLTLENLAPSPNAVLSAIYWGAIPPGPSHEAVGPVAFAESNVTSPETKAGLALSGSLREPWSAASAEPLAASAFDHSAGARLALHRVDDRFDLELSAGPASTWVLEASMDGADWTPLRPILCDEQGRGRFALPEAPSGRSAFFRVRAVEPRTGP